MDITINKDVISGASNSIITEVNELQVKINQFVAVIDKINVAWEGADAVKFINVLRDSYVIGLNELCDVIKEYSEYLKSVPEAYNLLDEVFASKNIEV